MDAGTGGRYHWHVEEGASADLPFAVKANDGTAQSLAGYEAEALFFAASGAVLLTLTSSPAAGIVIASSSGGLLKISLTATQTAALKTGGVVSYVVDLVGANRPRVLSGCVTVNPKVQECEC